MTTCISGSRKLIFQKFEQGIERNCALFQTTNLELLYRLQLATYNNSSNSADYFSNSLVPNLVPYSGISPSNGVHVNSLQNNNEASLCYLTATILLSAKHENSDISNRQNAPDRVNQSVHSKKSFFLGNVNSHNTNSSFLLFNSLNSNQVNYQGLLPSIQKRHYLTNSNPSEDAIVIGSNAEKRLNLLKAKSPEEQRKILISGIAKEFGFWITSDQVDADEVKTLLRKTEVQGEKTYPFYKTLHDMPASKWKDTQWDLAMYTLLNRLGIQEIPAVNSKKELEAMVTIDKSFWSAYPIPMIPNQMYSSLENDKKVSEQIIDQKVTQWRKERLNGHVVALHEGVWDGRFLMNLYIRLMKRGVATKLVATDINPASVALFQVYCRHILMLPEKDTFVFINSATNSLTRLDLEDKKIIRAKDSQVLNIYFRVIMDLEEEQALQLFFSKAQDMDSLDLFVVTLVEESADALQALQEAGLEKDFEGTFFTKYSRLAYGRESSVLILNKGGLKRLKKHLQKNDLHTFDEGKTKIAIDLGSEQTTNFEAHVIGFEVGNNSK